MEKVSEDNHLLVLKICDDSEKYIDWKIKRKAKYTGIQNGCGLNALSYLNVIHSEQHNELLKLFSDKTSFNDIMQILGNGSSSKLYAIPFNLETIENREFVFDYLQTQLCDNCCTMAKIEDTEDVYGTCGHSIIISKKNNKLYKTDPHLIKRTELTNDNLHTLNGLDIGNYMFLVYTHEPYKTPNVYDIMKKIKIIEQPINIYNNNNNIKTGGKKFTPFFISNANFSVKRGGNELKNKVTFGVSKTERCKKRRKRRKTIKVNL